MQDRSLLVIILAAGMGTRMKSSRPKVLHELAGKPMLAHVLQAANYLGADRMAVVVGPNMEEVTALVQKLEPEAQTYVQKERLGTAHAVLAARKVLAGFRGDVMVLYGDTPLITAPTLRALRRVLESDNYMGVLGFEARDPTGYGRLLCDADGSLRAVREEKDASAEEKAVTLCNSGVMCFRGEGLASLLEKIDNKNASGEYYLTDVVRLVRRQGLGVGVHICGEEEVMGVNARSELARAEQVMQHRLRQRAMEDGVTFLAPETVYLSADTRFGRDVMVEPHVYFGPGVKVGDNVTIRGFCHLEQAEIGRNVSVGPYARLRPGTVLAEEARVGNFVEIKNARIGERAKVNHLTYIGDATVGARANIGAGTITCNYDGFSKSRTHIGEEAFIGSNSSLVAPLKVGARAYIGSGSVITKDVAEDALALTRSPQIERAGWAKTNRSVQQAALARKKARK